jgi:excisionase family DNA binding protein
VITVQRETRERLWTAQDVAEYLGVPVATLYRWRCKAYGPPARRVGRYLRYRPDDVRAWVEALDTEVA